MSGAADHDRETVHASTVAIAGRNDAWCAVMLVGRSGAGKSDLALRLIDRGARLVADDYTDVRRDGDRLIATSPPRIAGLIEVRGIGLLTMAHLAEAAVALVVALDMDVERMPARAATRRIATMAVPLVALAPFEASAALKVEMALDRIGAAA